MAKPNIRKLFLPDEGFTLVEGDLKQADAQIVAWEAKDESLMQMFTEINEGRGVDIHRENAKIVYSTSDISEMMRQISKSVVHGTNYVGGAYEIARRLGLMKSQVQVAQARWFAAHPRIKEWHNEVLHELMTTRSITNIYGYRRIFFDRLEGLLPEALAWKPQSTVALTINTGIRHVIRELPEFQFLMQVHDSALFQIPSRLLNTERLTTLRNILTVAIPYPEPLRIRVDIKTSSRSWGEMEAWQKS